MNAERRGLRVLVVDDHDVVQWGFRLLLERQPWVERCLAASSGTEAVQVCRKVQPEVALVDMLLGTESGAEVCEEIHQVSPNTRVLLISGAGIISPNVARTAGAASGCCTLSSARAVSNQVSPSRRRPRACHSGCSDEASFNASSISEFSRLQPKVEIGRAHV